MNFCKKSISFILALLLAVSCFAGVTVYAYDTDRIPKIYVNGIGTRAVYMADDPQKTPVFFPMNSDLLMENLKGILNYAKESAADLDPDIIRNMAYNLMWDTCGMSVLDTDGISPKFNSTVDPCPLDYRGNGHYSFNFDSRLSPLDLAKQLREYIDWVLEDSGKDKIEFVASSYGTAIMAACLKLYPEVMDIADSVLFCVPTIGGMEFVGELFSGQVNTDAVLLKDYLSNMLGNDDLSLLLSVLLQTGTLDFIIEEGLEPAIEAALLDAAKDIVHDIFATFPSMWSYIQHDNFYRSLEYLYGENYADPNHEYAGLINRVITYHEEVMMKIDEIFDSLDSKNVHTGILVKYDKPLIPLTEKGNLMSDDLVTVECASFGAVSSRFGETLPEDYKQQLHTEYDMISPDRCIDASTGAYPFTTWYIKNLDHGTMPSGYTAMMDAIVYGDLDIHSDENYPQFMILGEDGESIVPFKEYTPEKKPTFVEECIALVKRIIEIIIEKLTSLFSK